jgi:putative tryptophan/tyrosine transport system substrate-binding protein
LVQDVGHAVSVKSLQLIKEAVPRSSRIAILTSAQAENTEALRLLETAAPSLGVTVPAIVVANQAEIESGFASMSRDRVDAMLAVPSHPLLTHRQLVVDLAARHRIPAIYWWDEFVQRGGLMSYGIDWIDLYRRSAEFVAKILKGAKPGDLPIEQPTKFELLVNLKAARPLGLTIPASFLVRADQIIE